MLYYIPGLIVSMIICGFYVSYIIDDSEDFVELFLGFIVVPFLGILATVLWPFIVLSAVGAWLVRTFKHRNDYDPREAL